MSRRPAQIALTVVAYVITTFAVQGASHFAVNADHFAAIPIMRAEPILALGIASMLIQAFIFAWLYPVYANGASSLRKSIGFSWLIGGFLASYIVFAEAGKYAIPSVPSWIAVEAGAAAVQFTLFGVCLGLIHRTRAESAALAAA
ncbi:MAG: hypothetical protein ACREOK_08350 [Gemmatimonadaceae bacterium]